MAVRIIVDSGCDILGKDAAEMGMDFLPLKTSFGETEYLDGISMNHAEFYEKLIETDVMPKTSQISPFEYEEMFQKIRAAGDTAVCITISGELSGCYQSAEIAVEDYGDCIEVVDSRTVSIGEQILVKYALRLRDEGKSAKEIADELNAKKGKICLIALLDTLEYLRRGGRISAMEAAAGNLMRIKPVIAVERGEVVVLGKARGSKKGNNMFNERIEQQGPIDFSMPYVLAYTGLSDALLQKYIEDNKEKYMDKDEELPITTIGSAIGTHVGPGAIGASFFVQ